FQFLLEPVALLAEAVSLALDLLPLALGPLKLPPQALVLLPQPLGLALELFPRCRLPPRRHCNGSKKAYIGSRIYNAPRRGPLTDYSASSSVRRGPPARRARNGYSIPRASVVGSDRPHRNDRGTRNRRSRRSLRQVG